jgi:hypothetical protein
LTNIRQTEAYKTEAPMWIKNKEQSDDSAGDRTSHLKGMVSADFSMMISNDYFSMMISNDYHNEIQ